MSEERHRPQHMFIVLQRDGKLHFALSSHFPFSCPNEFIQVSFWVELASRRTGHGVRLSTGFLVATITVSCACRHHRCCWDVSLLSINSMDVHS